MPATAQDQDVVTDDPDYAGLFNDLNLIEKTFL